MYRVKYRLYPEIHGVRWTIRFDLKAEKKTQTHGTFILDGINNNRNITLLLYMGREATWFWYLVNPFPKSIQNVTLHALLTSGAYYYYYFHLNEDHMTTLNFSHFFLPDRVYDLSHSWMVLRDGKLMTPYITFRGQKTRFLVVYLFLYFLLDFFTCIVLKLKALL